jgi:hypothetical protein
MVVSVQLDIMVRDVKFSIALEYRIIAHLFVQEMVYVLHQIHVLVQVVIMVPNVIWH